MENIEKIKLQCKNAINDLLEQADLKEGDILVLGGSSSEIVGGNIGKDSSKEVGEVIISEILSILSPLKINLAVQGCEHINRSLVVERKLSEAKDLDIVSVIPALNAGGSFSVAAYSKMDDPVMVEHIIADAGIDIGDTEIGMHVRFVQVPLRLDEKYIGEARVTALKSRPKLIGGARAQYKL